MIRTFVLASRRCLESTRDPTPPSLARLCYAQTFVHVGEYVEVVHALTLNKPLTPSNETIRLFHLLHPLVKVDFPPFVDDFHLEMEVILD